MRVIAKIMINVFIVGVSSKIAHNVPSIGEGSKNINNEFRNRNKQKDFNLWVQTP